MAVMVHSVAVKNFFSIHDPVEINFTVGPKAGQRRVFLKSSQAGIRVNSATGVFGPNASGKTNLLKVLGFLKHFIVDSASVAPGEKIAFDTFRFVPQKVMKSAPAEFKLEFEHQDVLYRYELQATQHRVIKESLYRKDIRWRYLFDRQWNDSQGSYVIRSQDIGPTRHVPLRENASFISSARLQEYEFAVHITAFFDRLYANLHLKGRTRDHDPALTNIIQAASFYSQHPQVFKSAVDYLKECDLGIADLIIREHSFILEDGKDRKLPWPVFLHRVNGETFELPWLDQSHGTQAIFVLLRYILPVLVTGGIAVIDEFDTGLHSHVIVDLIELFYSESSNPKGAQLIASFHTDHLMESTLDKYQIVLTEKNPESLSTEAWRLDEMKGLARSDHNYLDKYHAGAYGGIPNL